MRFLDLVMIGVTFAAPVGFVAAPLALAANGRRRAGLVLGGTLAFSFALSLELQYLTLRPRPAGVPLIPAPPTPSFPSGHAVMAFAAAVLLGLVARRARWPLLAAAALAGASRV